MALTVSLRCLALSYVRGTVVGSSTIVFQTVGQSGAETAACESACRKGIWRCDLRFPSHHGMQLPLCHLLCLT